MSDIVTELREKKKKIEQLQQLRARQEGQREQLTKRLKEEFGIDAEDVEETLKKQCEELVQNEESLKKCRDEMEGILSGIHPKDSARESKEE